MKTTGNLQTIDTRYAKISVGCLPREAVDHLLEHNVGNRPISMRRVEMMARDIERDEWRYNGATIVVDHNGTLRDGQHRLAAIRRAGYPALPITLVWLKASPVEAEEAYMTMDNGKSRSYNDNLSHDGVKYCATIGALCRQLGYFQFGSQYLTRGELETVRSNYADEMELGIMLSNKSRSSVAKLPCAGIAAIMRVVHDLGMRDRVVEFITAVMDGVGLQPKSAGLALFAYLTKRVRASTMGSGGYDRFARVVELVSSGLAGSRPKNPPSDKSARERVDAAIASARHAIGVTLAR